MGNDAKTLDGPATPGGKRRILAIGEILVEIVATSTGSGFRQPIPLTGPFASGAPAIFIDQAARLGQPCGIVGRVGDDDFGRLNLDRLRADGADVSAISTDPDRPTGSAFVRYRPDGGRDFVFNIAHAACGALAASPEADALIDRADHLHVAGSSLTAPRIAAMIVDATERIKARGGTVSFDPNLRPEILKAGGLGGAFEAVMARTDVFLPSGEELFLPTRARDEGAALREIFARGVVLVAIKRGRDGASCHSATEDVFEPGFAAEEIDPTGAGDAFGATFVTMWLRDLPLREALVCANAAGALAVGRQGPMEGNASLPEIMAFRARAGR